MSEPTIQPGRPRKSRSGREKPPADERLNFKKKGTLVPADGRYAVEPGRPHPLGARPDAEGTNFSIFSRHATGLELLLFDRHDAPEPYQVIALDPAVNRTFCFWHCYVRGLAPGANYAFRADGPWDPAAGHRFNRNKVLVDPYAFGNSNDLWVRGEACHAEDNVATSMRSVVIDPTAYDWEGDAPLNRPMRETVIYEMHVGGFTKASGSGVSAPGTFRGVVEKIPYLQSLGITAVEMLPVFEFDEKEILRVHDGRELKNYWGYSTFGFFAPTSNYCVSPELGAHLDEFRDMVKALHKAGIEVILDVVFNHTNEGNQLGPTISFRGLDNSVYYYLVSSDRQYYMDYGGCGNTVNCNHPAVEKLITESLEFWVREMHVDGFRFDEGSILSRGEDGAPVAHPPILWHIEFEKALADTKVIAEAWDAAGLYQIGYFPGLRWGEWNGRYRDSIRRFVAGQPGIVAEVATRIAGSADLYRSSGRLPTNSINFVSCHDGFTMNDLVSFNGKHNEANGEDNRDGADDNASWNCGVEGPADDPGVEALRSRQVKNFAAILLLSEGVPMILGGDEMRRTQGGNNNAYCQDNEISWVDWSLAERHADVVRFFREMIAFRKRHLVLQRRTYFGGSVSSRGLADVTWHGCELEGPGWHDPSSRVLAWTLGGDGGDEDVHVILNMSDEALVFELPPVEGRRWHMSVDTSAPSPGDIAAAGDEVPISQATLAVPPRTVVALVSR
jgi:glycogen operon protein